MRLLVFALLLLAATSASAQPVVSVHAGYVDFDLSGVGQTAVVDARINHALNRFVALEGGLGFSITDQQYGRVAYLLPGGEVQLGVGIGSVRPYLGAGLGLLVPVNDPGERTFGTNPQYTVDIDPSTRFAATAAIGLDLNVAGPWVARSAGRLRANGSNPFEFSGTFAEVVVGVGYRL